MSTNGVNGSNGHHDERTLDDGEVDVDDPQLQTYFTERNGRRYHTSTSPYPLPLDNLEVQVRLLFIYFVLGRLWTLFSLPAEICDGTQHHP